MRRIEDPHAIITPIQSGKTFPGLLEEKISKYKQDILDFVGFIHSSSSSAQLLETIRSPGIHKDTRMSYLKLFRRCVSPVCDTEATKKIKGNPTSLFVDNYGHLFKNIADLQREFAKVTEAHIASLSVLLGEYDDRGTQGYELTNLFFTWFESTYSDLYSIDGPRGAGQDIQLSTLLSDFEGDYPCDFIITRKADKKIVAVGFARYDSTRGGAQSDDRTGGNTNKVTKAIDYKAKTGNSYKVLFLSDGPGLAHKDTWEESCHLDDSWDGNARVTTLITCPERITVDWLNS